MIKKLQNSDKVKRFNESIINFPNYVYDYGLIITGLFFNLIKYKKPYQKNITIARSLVGNFTTSLDMAGGSITVTKLDQEIIKHWDSPVHTAALRWKI